MSWTRSTTASLGLAVLLASHGCGPAGGPEEFGPVHTPGTAGVAGGAVAPPIDTAVPQPVHWEAPILDSTLHALGFTPFPIARGEDPFMSVPASVYRIDELTVRTYFFGDPVAAARRVRQIVRRGDTTTVFTSNNMLVEVRGRDSALRNRIRRTLTDPEVRGTLTP